MLYKLLIIGHLTSSTKMKYFFRPDLLMKEEIFYLEKGNTFIKKAYICTLFLPNGDDLD